MVDITDTTIIEDAGEICRLIDNSFSTSGKSYKLLVGIDYAPQVGNHLRENHKLDNLEVREENSSKTGEIQYLFKYTIHLSKIKWR